MLRRRPGERRRPRSAGTRSRVPWRFGRFSLSVGVRSEPVGSDIEEMPPKALPSRHVASVRWIVPAALAAKTGRVLGDIAILYRDYRARNVAAKAATEAGLEYTRVDNAAPYRKCSLTSAAASSAAWSTTVETILGNGKAYTGKDDDRTGHVYTGQFTSRRRWRLPVSDYSQAPGPVSETRFACDGPLVSSWSISTTAAQDASRKLHGAPARKWVTYARHCCSAP